MATPLMMAGCGHSPPTRFFTLDPLPAAGPPANAAIAPVQLDAVQIPAGLDRPEMVVQTGANALKIDDFDQWGAPLGELMRRTLAQDLLARLPAGAFVLPDAPRGPGVRALVVDVLQLQSDASGQVQLQASWSVTSGAIPPGAPAQAKPAPAVATQVVQLTATGAPGAAGQAAAVSQLMGQLADRIAAGLS